MSLPSELVERFSGPMAFRLILQPAMATFLAVRAGRRDARLGAPPYLATLLTRHGHRREMLLDLWRGVGRVFIFALFMEVAYQVIVSRSVSVLEAVAISLPLAILPYIVLRGLVNRFVRKTTSAPNPPSA